MASQMVSVATNWIGLVPWTVLPALPPNTTWQTGNYNWYSDRWQKSRTAPHPFLVTPGALSLMYGHRGHCRLCFDTRLVPVVDVLWLTEDALAWAVTTH